MCTAITYRSQEHYFGRNLDLEYHYQESVTITPRNYPFRFRKAGRIDSHHAMIGVAYVMDNYPLYYDAANELGLSMAGLHFPGSAVYRPEAVRRDPIAPFELIPWILGQCATVSEARKRLKWLDLVDIPFSETLPTAPLHWIVADRDEAIVVEAVRDGLRVYDNPAGVLTNNPPFDYQMTNLCNYMGLSSGAPENRFSEQLALKPFSRGMGALGLPGDFSSVSRFVKAAFLRANAVPGSTEEENVNQFFHLLNAVAMPRGCIRLDEDKYERTVYSSCCNTDRGIYYYTTYENSTVTAVNLYAEELDGDDLISFLLDTTPRFRYQNRLMESNPSA